MRGRKFDLGSPIEKYREAFRNDVIDIEALTRQEATARLRSSAIRGTLAAALDDWDDYEKPALKSRLLDLAREADPDKRRNAVHGALAK